MNYRTKINFRIGGICVLFFVIMLGIWVLFSYFEAKHFNEITGRHITTKQAMFMQLRITDIDKE